MCECALQSLSCCHFSLSSLALLHISLGTSKVLVQYFQVGSLQGFSGASVGVLENCVYLSFAETLLQSVALKMSPTGEHQCVKKAF